jgi:hypothetical protein
MSKVAQSAELGMFDHFVLAKYITVFVTRFRHFGAQESLVSMIIFFRGVDDRARLPGKTAGQDCRARLPGKTAGQDCRARLPGKTAGQYCRA